MIPADSIMLDHSVILSNESSLTGETNDLKKSRDKDCFLLSSCLVTDGEQARAMVIGIGPFSQWGKIKANLVTESVNTPLQDKLMNMTNRVRYLYRSNRLQCFLPLYNCYFVRSALWVLCLRC